MPAAAPSLPAARPKNGQPHALPIFLIALLIGVGIHLAGLALFRLKVDLPASSPAQQPVVHFAKATDASQAKIMSQAAAIFDPQLLYLPTSRNFASRAVEKTKSPQPQVFSADASLALPNATPDDFPLHASADSQPTSSSDVLKPAQWDFVGTLGLAADAGSELPKRGPQLRITPRRTGTTASSAQAVTWPVTMTPKADNARWKPVSFSLFFGSSGLVGEPLAQGSSGVQAVDDDLRVKLRQWFGRHPLPSGYYTVEVGP